MLFTKSGIWIFFSLTQTKERFRIMAEQTTTTKLEIDGQLNETLYRKIVYMTKKMCGNKWEDVLQDVVVDWLKNPRPISHLENVIRNIMRPDRRHYGREIGEVATTKDIVDELFPDSTLPIDKMVDMWADLGLTADNLREYLALRIKGMKVNKIVAQLNFSRYLADRIEEYLKDYYTYHANETMRVCLGFWGERHEKMHGYSFGDTKKPTKNNIVRQYYIREFVDCQKLARRTALSVAAIEEIVEFWRQGKNDNYILECLKDKKFKSDFTENYQFSITSSLLEGLKIELFNQPLAIFITPLEKSRTCLNTKGNTSPELNYPNTICTRGGHFCEKKSSIFEKFPKKIKCKGKVWTVQNVDDLKMLLDEIGISYREQQLGLTAENTLLIQEQCGECGGSCCVQVYFQKHKLSWVCHKCRVKSYGGQDGIHVKMDEFYKEYKNNLLGLLKLLGFEQI